MREEEPIVQGTVDVQGVAEVAVLVRPFFNEGGKEALRRKLPVLQGRFEGRIRLFPGVNLVSIETLGGGASAHYALAFLPVPNAAAPRDWGRLSQVIISSPQDTRVETPALPVQGVVTDAGIQAVYLLGMTPQKLLSLSGGAVADADGPLPVTRLEVRDRGFAGVLPLQTGTNILLLRPDQEKASFPQVATKSVLYEHSTPGLHLERPVLADNRLRVRGRLHRRRGEGAVEVTVTWLAKEKEGAGPPLRHSSKAAAQTDGEGRFSLDLPSPFAIQGIDIVDFPVVEARAGKESAARSLLRSDAGE